MNLSPRGTLNLDSGEKARARVKIDEYRRIPKSFFHEVLGKANHWYKQQEVIDSVVKHRRTTVRSGHGVGKSYVGSDIALWFLYTNPNSIVITTAPTWRQVEKVMWGEIASHWMTSKLPLGGKLLETEIKIGPKWYAIGFSSDTKDAFQGFHADHILVIVDEPSGVEEDTCEQIESLMVNENARLLLIGNPIRKLGYFYDSHFGLASANFNKIHISCMDSPNVKSGKVLVKGLVTREWVEERKVAWGEDSPVFQSRVLGEFPDETDDVLIKLSWIQASKIRFERNKNHKLQGQTEIGLDVARMGKCKTVFTVRTGRRIREIISYRGFDLMHTVGVARRLLSEYSPDNLFIDDNGVGGGVTDRLFELGYKNIVPVIAGAEADDKKKFYNKRSEMAWRVREAMRTEELDIPDNEDLEFQCNNQFYDHTSDEKLRVMSKSLMRKKGLESPDFFDALSLTYAKDMPEIMAREVKQYSSEFTDFVHVLDMLPPKLGVSRFQTFIPMLNGDSYAVWFLADKEGMVYFYDEALISRVTASLAHEVFDEHEAHQPKEVDLRYTKSLYFNPDDQGARYNLIKQLDDYELFFEEVSYNEDIAGMNLREGLRFDMDRPIGINNHPYILFSPKCEMAIRAVKYYLNPKVLKNDALYEAVHMAVGISILTEPAWLKIYG